jgi:type I restriction-modification system DNA methylase subunit
VLFRDEEREMRRKLIEQDWVECVIGLGPNLFYNSPMEACVMICRTHKPSDRKGKILLINAVDEVTGNARRASWRMITFNGLRLLTAPSKTKRVSPGDHEGGSA